MKIIYRIYEVTSCKYGIDKMMIAQDVCESPNLEEFKKMIISLYGKEIKFKKTSKSKEGDIICTIISTCCYNPEEYLSLIEFECSYCHKTVKTSPIYRSKLMFNSYELNELQRLNFELYHKDHIDSKTFCCNNCKQKFLEQKTKEYNNDNDNKDYFPELFQSRGEWNKKGYIYCITKKSTQEFYVGKSNALPVFRWAQHLKTERFPIKNITDYSFEVLEEVEDLRELSSREAFWIIKKRNENPANCLNIVIPHI